MNAIIPPKRRDGRSSFLQLVAYQAVRDDISLKDEIKEDQRFQRPSRSREVIFERLLDYMNRSTEATVSEITGLSEEGDIRVNVDGVISQMNTLSIETAAAEMNSIAMQNVHVKDPVYHYILSWQQDENPQDDRIFDSVKHSLSRLGMSEHQYVASIHRDTDNVHVHVAASRVHPVTFRAANIWNDADKLQRSCRELELKHGFKVDNGSWVRDADNQIVRARKGYKRAPRGAATLEHFGDRESLHAFAVTHCREKINLMFRAGTSTWPRLHEVVNAAGLSLERRGQGLVIRDAMAAQPVAIKASRLHTGMTLHHLEKRIGAFIPGESDSAVLAQKITHPAYNDMLHVRDRGGRAERRLARAEARQVLRERYQAYRQSWVKPDLGAAERFRAIAAAFRDQKMRVRASDTTPVMRKLMYHVVEFEREKSMAALRIQLKAERQALQEAGKLRPMPYRTWTEQEALKGDGAAISQLRGWAYREGRKNRTPVESDTLILCAPADDTRLLRGEGLDVTLNRDGAAVYRQDGKVAVIDRGDSVEVRDAYGNHELNTGLGIDLVSWKCGERIVFTDDGLFPEAAGRAVAEHNYTFRDNMVIPTDMKQQDYAVGVFQQLKHQRQGNSSYDYDETRARQEERLRQEAAARQAPRHTWKP